MQPKLIFIIKILYHQNVILILSGSLCPVHTDHIRIMNIAKSHLKKSGNTSVSGFLCPSSDQYVSKKLGSWALTLKHRCEMISQMINENKNSKDSTIKTDWLQVSKLRWMSGSRTAVKIYRVNAGFYKNLKVYQVMVHTSVQNSKYGKELIIICIGRKDDIEKIKSELKETGYVNMNFILID